ncbi:SDR family oxidoreductase [Sphaerimonospora thailandensis]|nr:SDR family oxidoreductase [Sphaerimonospora thailandensis]
MRVNATEPGAIGSDNTIDEMQQIHRMATMADIVNAMNYLCTDAAGMVTGQTLPVSGGYPLQPS